VIEAQAIGGLGLLEGLGQDAMLVALAASSSRQWAMLVALGPRTLDLVLEEEPE
jgi:hypothetical protein